MEPKRYESLDGLRALACLGIVLMHVLANTDYNLSGFFFRRIIPSFTDFVFLFMIISGFAMCCGYYEKIIDNKVSIVSFYSKRYIKILPFFAFLSLVEIIVSPSISAVYEAFANITLCFGLIPNASISVIGVGWFLGVVFVFYLVFPFYCFLLADKKRAWLSFIVSYGMNYLCRIYFGVDRYSFIYCFVFFLAGGLVFLYKDILEKSSSVRWISVLVLLLSTVFYYIRPEYLIFNIALDVSLLILVIGLKGSNILNNKVSCFFGGLSFEIYLCHMFVFRFFEKIKLLRLFNNDYADYFIIVILVFAGATVFSLFFQHIWNAVLSFIERRVKK